METKFFQLAYLSRATEPFEEAELFQLIDHSQKNNKAKGLSGMLVYNSGYFLQLLEGPADLVNATMDRIARDPRHVDIKRVFENQASQRIFGSWYMAYKNLSTFNPLLRQRVENLITKLAGKSNVEHPDEFIKVLQLMRQEF
ncbi:MAG TPA: BLUF domain-containing protein [Oligoflexus sp.]|uniref:BLUF domain-containing protein n=1 Tax=Oligoflexus sp. TaxID=1971216 RepID=UPI002D2B9DBA|nr:BLUF domain-containing protein [Oligoflexus sp.]HYX32298.1 BLUF domain-containing protein [Oligoflexus sp.]